MNKYNKILIFLLMLIGLSPALGQEKEVDALVSEGIAFHDKGDFKKAIELYKMAMEIDPDAEVIKYEMALSYMSARNYPEAIKYSKALIKADSKYSMQAYIVYGSSLDIQGESKKAMKVFEKGIAKYENSLLYYNHALTCFNLGLTDKAYESAIKAIDNNPSHASSHMILSEIMGRKGSRIKTMLPLYYFLYLEPNSSRSASAYQKLRNFSAYGISEKEGSNIDVTVPSSDDSDFGPLEFTLSISRVANLTEENKDKTDMEQFYLSNKALFGTMKELRQDKTGFWQDFYVSFFSELVDEELIEVFSYYISISKGDEILEWLEDHDSDFQRFATWAEGGDKSAD